MRMVLNILLVQLRVAPVQVNLDERIAHAEQLIQKGLKDKPSVHLIVLPETSFCSYCQSDEASALRVGLEQEAKVKGWGERIASERSCYVAFGYIGVETTTGKPKNALALFAPSGKLVHDQKKRFLYDSDKVWTKECASEFSSVELTMLPGAPRVMFAICNDINAKDFSDSEMNTFPLANSARTSSASVIILSAAWCSAHPLMPPEEHDIPVTEDQQIDYWLDRLSPLHGKRVFFCCADLVGREAIPGTKSRIRYCGSSCGIDLSNGQVIAGPLDTEAEGTLFFTLSV